MERKSPIEELYKSIPQDLPSLYEALCSKLGDSNPFAKFSIGSGTYIWKDDRYQWQKMVDAGDDEQPFIKDALHCTIESVSKIIGVKTANALFITPDDSYLYYYDDGDQTRILVTGWGF